jgi:hypothetical protein
LRDGDIRCGKVVFQLLLTSSGSSATYITLPSCTPDTSRLLVYRLSLPQLVIHSSIYRPLPKRHRLQLCNSCQHTNWLTSPKSSRHLIAGATAGCRTLRR